MNYETFTSRYPEMNQIINEVYSQLANVVTKTYSKVAHEVLIKTSHGIVVYNKYVIRNIPTGFEIVSRTGTRTRIFSSAKNALVWAILDHHNKFFESDRVEELDATISSLEVACKIHEKLKKRGNTENYLIQTNKLQRGRTRQKQFIYEIDKYIILAQKCQTKGLQK